MMKKAVLTNSRLQVILAIFLACGNAIKIVEERSNNNQRYVTMTELEEKSAYYLRRYQRIGDKEEIKEKVKIMCDRLEELYREHGLDALHDLFENIDDLELAIGREDRWLKFVNGLVYPRPPPEFKYARHFLVSVATTFIIAVVLATPFSYKYAKRFVKGKYYNNVDVEWKGADGSAIVIAQRRKRRTRRILFKPMLPRFDIKTELQRTTKAELEKAKEDLKFRLKKQEVIKAKRQKKWEEMLRESRLDMMRRSKLLEDGGYDDDDGSNKESFDKWALEESDKKEENSRRTTKFVVDYKLKNFWQGESRMRKRKK